MLLGNNFRDFGILTTKSKTRHGYLIKVLSLKPVDEFRTFLRRTTTVPQSEIWLNGYYIFQVSVTKIKLNSLFFEEKYESYIKLTAFNNIIIMFYLK